MDQRQPRHLVQLNDAAAATSLALPMRPSGTSDVIWFLKPARASSVGARASILGVSIGPGNVADHAAVSSLAVHTLDARIADALSRLVALSQRPGDIAVLAPLIKREISYYLLSGPAGPALRQLASATSQLTQIAAAIEIIRRGYAQPLRAADLARAAHMSLAAFYRAFNAVTHMSPLRYQQQLRLQQARRMLIAERADVAGIGATVGYESPSQFSREYRRFFGTPPSAEYQSGRGLARQSVEA